MRLTYLGDLFRFGQEGRCSLDPGRPAVRFPRWPTGSGRSKRTIQCLVTWAGGGAECQKVVKESLYSPEFPEVCADLSH